MKNQPLTAILLIIILGLTLTISGCTTNQNNGSKKELKVLHAGSLSKPFKDIEQKFESEYEVEVKREPAGSVSTVRKVTDAGKTADIVAVADYNLIPELMFEEHANWYGGFATNQMVIAYSENSKYSNQISSENWHEILEKEDVRFGVSDGNQDPCGYRSLMVIELAENYYEETQIFDDLIKKNTNIGDKGKQNNKTILMPESSEINPSDKIMVRAKETDLVSGLESGEIDYFFIYRSVAQQHGFEFVKLPAEIDLSSVKHSNNYEKVSVRRVSGEVSVGKPIVYGITIPKNTENPEIAAKFVKFVLSDKGKEILKEKGQPPIKPALVNDLDKLPESIKNLVEEK